MEKGIRGRKADTKEGRYEEREKEIITHTHIHTLFNAILIHIVNQSK